MSEGVIRTSHMRAKVLDAAATVWVHSLDGVEIPKSRRLLLTHLTDVQGDGVKFADESMTTTLRWGGRPLVKNGSVHVALRLDEPGDYRVYELATSGRRMGVVPAKVRDGEWLCFPAEVAGPNGARILYEVVASAERK